MKIVSIMQKEALDCSYEEFAYTSDYVAIEHHLQTNPQLKFYPLFFIANIK